MGTGRHLRHHAAEAGMQVGLRGNDARQNLQLFGEYRSRRLVTGSLDRQKVHPFYPGAPTLADRGVALAPTRLPLASGHACHRPLCRKELNGLSYTTLLTMS